MSFTLPQEIQDELDKAVEDRDAAKASDVAHDKAVADLAAAQSQETFLASASVVSHQAALDSAHVVIDALTKLLEEQPAASPAPTPAAQAKK